MLISKIIALSLMSQSLIFVVSTLIYENDKKNQNKSVSLKLQYFSKLVFLTKN